eukprot:TRINITY_DN13312_c0_g1_i1.p1 TRINITY_DN13312_c0_g1~~TRINITY_DN13312_c0_g1_i1.p1  ORF type:complete len:321 (-),score=43.90 TRINITY_DN13312_c0_g1_i1:1-930(-)
MSSEKLMKRMDDPNNLKWAEDKDRFGYKMLLKMGWSDGKGLGANEDGLTTYVKVDKRQDNRGIGAEQKSETWVHSGSDFEKVLKNLSAVANEINQKTKEMEESKMTKKEKKSKKKYASSSSSSSDSDSDSSDSDSSSDSSSSSDSDSDSDSSSSSSSNSDSDSSSSSSSSDSSSSSSSNSSKKSSASSSKDESSGTRKRFVPRHFIPTRVLRSKSPTVRYSKEAFQQIFAQKQQPIKQDNIPEKYRKPVVEDDNYGVMTVQSSASMEDYFKQKLSEKGKDVPSTGGKGLKRKRDSEESLLNKKSKKAKN